MKLISFVHVPSPIGSIFYSFSVCHDDLTRPSKIIASSEMGSASSASIYSPISWCPSSSDASKYIEIDFGMPKMVTGIGIQGDSNNDNWVKTFRISHGNSKVHMQELSQVILFVED